MSGLRIENLDFEQVTDVVEEAAVLLVREVIAEKCQEVWPVTEDEIDDETEDLIRAARSYSRRLYAILGEGGEVVAAAEVGHEDKDITSVQHIAVARRRRREGIGTMLMKHIAGEAAAHGDEEIRLVSLEDGFFERLGFRFDYEDKDHHAASPKTVLDA